MTPARAKGAVLAATLVLLRDHSDILRDDAQRLAQAHQLERVGALLEEATDETGRLELRGEAAVLCFSLLVDCVARLGRAAAEAPELARARARLTDWRDTLIKLRDAAITARLRRGPARRPDRRRRNGHNWNPPAPGD